jgi:hypothetical protein
MNVRFFRRVAAQMILQLRHFLCCERVQRENRTHRLGSFSSFTALVTSGRFGKSRRSLHSGRTGKMRDKPPFRCGYSNGCYRLFTRCAVL